MANRPEKSLEQLDRLVGTWRTAATHPALPDVLVEGIAQITWLEGFKFLIVRANSDHPDFPDSMSVIGFTDQDRAGGSGHGDDVDEEDDDAGTDDGGDDAAAELTQHYYDSRGVFRTYTATIDKAAWRISRMAPGFSQRFTGTFEDDGNTIVGVWELSTDDRSWHRDLAITYQRVRSDRGA